MTSNDFSLEMLSSLHDLTLTTHILRSKLTYSLNIVFGLIDRDSSKTENVVVYRSRDDVSRRFCKMKFSVCIWATGRNVLKEYSLKMASTELDIIPNTFL